MDWPEAVDDDSMGIRYHPRSSANNCYSSYRYMCCVGKFLERGERGGVAMRRFDEEGGIRFF